MKVCAQGCGMSRNRWLCTVRDRGRLKHPRSLPCIHPGIVVWPTVRYESDCLSNTDPSLEASSPPSLAPVRRRSETPLMPSSREMNTRATSHSLGTVGAGTATHLQHTPTGSRALGSRTFQGDQALDPKVPSNCSIPSTRVTKTSGTLGGKSFTGINCMQICTVSNTGQ